MGFVNLHLHTEYSLLDGACVIDRLVVRLKELGQTACAITDHGNMYGAVEFYKACKKADIKPIIGCEVYVAPRTRFDKQHMTDSKPYHLILLCKNKTGYQNLIQLVSLGFIDGFYNKPRIDRELLEKYHEGLICLSACLAGELPRALAANDYAHARETALYYKNLFGPGCYYLELQDHGIPEQKRILPLFKRLSEETGVPLVCTNDCHYLAPEDAKTQSVLMCIQTNTVFGENNAMEFPTEEFYVKSEESMAALFEGFPGAVENTVKIAEQCNYDFEFGVTKLPRFVVPGVEDNAGYFSELCRRGLRERYGENPAPEVGERLEYELSVIQKMGYVDYFLIVWDFISYARAHDIPVGPGRGSGAGSLCAYCVGITGVDPIRYNLLFERFLNPERISMPDFDIDFCYEKRQRVIDYVVEKYGSDHVAQIITFGTMAAKGAVRDVGRALGMPYQTVDSVAKMIPFELNITLDKALLLSKELKAAYDTDEKIHELLDTARKLEGMPRHASTHAAGVVITRDPASSYVPLQKNDEAIVTQYTMTTLEELGLLKMDFLGLRNLTVIDQCEKEIRKRNPDFCAAAVPLDDKAVFSMLAAGDTQGVFQFESAGMRRVLTQLGPESVEDLIAVISLYRPGPMESIPLYIRNRHNPALITYKHPLLKPILEVTYGCIVYQEQVMQICRQLAGYSYGRADLVRRAMSKKKHAVMELERNNFIYGKTNEDGSVECTGAIAHGVDEPIANAIFDEMAGFASYAFNKSHAAAYSFVAYQTAYLKCHYLREYMAALLTSVLGNTDKVIEYTAECSAHGIRVLPPDINKSQMGFSADGGDIRFGLLAVKNMGRSAIQGILEERERGGEYRSLFDFIERLHGKDINKRAIESLIKCGAFDGFPHNRMEMMRAFERIADSVDDTARRNLSGQLDLFGSQNLEKPELTIPSLEDFPPQERIAMEKEVTGLFLSGHPLDGFYPPRGVRLTNISEITGGAPDSELSGEADEAVQSVSLLKDGAAVNLLCVVQSKKAMTTRAKASMAFLTVEDRTGGIEVIVFPNRYEQYQAMLNKDTVLLLSGKVSLREDEPPKLTCETVRLPLTEAPPPEPPPRRLFLKLAAQEGAESDSVLRILARHPGTDEVSFRFSDTGKLVAYKKFGVAVDDGLLAELNAVLNSRNIAVR